MSLFQVNVLGHMYLADVLLNHRPPRHSIHFVCVSSALFKLCGASWPRWKLPKEASAWADAFAPRTRSGWRAYALSKFAITLLASRLNRVEDVTAVAVNPGNAITNVSKNMPDRHRKMLAVFKKTLITVVSANPLKFASELLKSVKTTIKSLFFSGRSRRQRGASVAQPSARRQVLRPVEDLLVAQGAHLRAVHAQPEPSGPTARARAVPVDGQRPQNVVC
ncbi:hypothetical protein Y032_0034g2796 [Ancylostoma ceylanicum]|uniref:Oxidoreductase, short chain dehydrogenase/reductase family protein n=1 Tax=Ancylostoma ceylanicum TaxID=53326 RepID=A0A016ULR0_9BILA|nr:hypothetical protein Y032_0034g2796 [Ancylostoma ceylanicum]